jgi:predicted phosphodiesterase
VGQGGGNSTANDVNPSTSSHGARVTFAVISDMHCRLAKDPTDSSLEVGSARIPQADHPVQALLDLIEKRGIRADALLIPGDLTNRASREGLSQAWDFALEIGAALRCKRTIPVLGNHDIDSQRSVPEREPFYNARNLRPGFPFREPSAVQGFFSDGFCVLDVGRDTQIVAINTVIDHHDEESAKRGTFDHSRIVRLAQVLHEFKRTAIRVALMHHHPVLHSGPFKPDRDVLATGDALLQVLREHGCALIIHGHKHLARLTVVNGTPVLACGSFSANLGIYASSMANMFHLIDLEHANGSIRGRIETWVFHYSLGWGRANPEHSGFPHLTGFGSLRTVQEIETELAQLATANAAADRLSAAQVAAASPELVHLTPSELATLASGLEARALHLREDDAGCLELWRKVTG